MAGPFADGDASDAIWNRVRIVIGHEPRKDALRVGLRRDAGPGREEIGEALVACKAPDIQHDRAIFLPVSYTHLRAHETRHDLVCRLLLEKKQKNKRNPLALTYT